jgi:hypothetical protein
MSLEQPARDGLENPKTRDTNPLYAEIVKDQQSESKKDKKDQTETNQDLHQANEALHKNGFPDLVITGVDSAAGKFTTNQGEFDANTLNARMASSDASTEKLKVTKSGEKVTDVDLPNADKTHLHFAYNGNDLTEYTDDHGDRYKKNGDGAWEHQGGKDKEGKDTPADRSLNHDRKVSVDENGVVTEQSKDLTVTKKIYPTGRVEETNDKKDLTVYENGAKVFSSGDGKQTTVDYPEGSGHAPIVIDRDPTTGNATKITEKGTGTNGADKVIAENKDGKWVDGDNKPLKDVVVDKDGNYTLSYEDGHTKEVRADGSEKTTDTHGKITEVKSAGGKHSITIDRDADGNPGEIKQDGKTVAKWIQPEGDKPGHWEDGYQRPLKGEPKVDENGKVTLDYPNGTSVDINSDGTRIFHGRRTDIKVNSEDLSASHVVKKGDTMWAIAEDNIVRCRRDGKRPGVADIQKEIERIAEEYNKTHKDKPIKKPYNSVPVGVELPLG